MSANDEVQQVGGDHYTRGSGKCPSCGVELQHWDIVRMFNLNYFIGTATKYFFRFRDKGMPLEDLKKGRSYIDKEIEHLEQRTSEPIKDTINDPRLLICDNCHHELGSHAAQGCDESDCECRWPGAYVAQCSACKHAIVMHNSEGKGCQQPACICRLEHIDLRKVLCQNCGINQGVNHDKYGCGNYQPSFV